MPVPKRVRIPAKQVEFMQGMYNRDAAPRGFLPAVHGEANHAMTVDDIRTKRIYDPTDPAAKNRIPAREEFVNITSRCRKFGQS